MSVYSVCTELLRVLPLCSRTTNTDSKQRRSTQNTTDLVTETNWRNIARSYTRWNSHMHTAWSVLYHTTARRAPPLVSAKSSFLLSAWCRRFSSANDMLEITFYFIFFLHGGQLARCPVSLEVTLRLLHKQKYSSRYREFQRKWRP